MEMTIGEETIDIKIMIIIEVIVDIEGDKTLGEDSVLIEADQEKEGLQQEEMVIEGMTVQM